MYTCTGKGKQEWKGREKFVWDQKKEKRENHQKGKTTPPPCILALISMTHALGQETAGGSQMKLLLLGVTLVALC